MDKIWKLLIKEIKDLKKKRLGIKNGKQCNSRQNQILVLKYYKTK